MVQLKANEMSRFQFVDAWLMTTPGDKVCLNVRKIYDSADQVYYAANCGDNDANLALLFPEIDYVLDNYIPELDARI